MEPVSKCSDRHRHRQYVERILGLHPSDRGTTGQMATQPVLRGKQQLLLFCHHFLAVKLLARNGWTLMGKSIIIDKQNASGERSEAIAE